MENYLPSTIGAILLQNVGDSLVGNQYSHRVNAEVTFHMQIPNCISIGVLGATLIAFCPGRWFTY